MFFAPRRCRSRRPPYSWTACQGSRPRDFMLTSASSADSINPENASTPSPAFCASSPTLSMRSNPSTKVPTTNSIVFSMMRSSPMPAATAAIFLPKRASELSAFFKPSSNRAVSAPRVTRSAPTVASAILVAPQLAVMGHRPRLHNGGLLLPGLWARPIARQHAFRVLAISLPAAALRHAMPAKPADCARGEPRAASHSWRSTWF